MHNNRRMKDGPPNQNHTNKIVHSSAGCIKILKPYINLLKSY